MKEEGSLGDGWQKAPGKTPCIAFYVALGLGLVHVLLTILSPARQLSASEFVRAAIFITVGIRRRICERKGGSGREAAGIAGKDGPNRR